MAFEFRTDTLTPLTPLPTPHRTPTSQENPNSWFATG